jgi:Ca-activated chloride channel family protein
MIFEHPLYLFFLPALLPLVLAMILRYRKSRKMAEFFASAVPAGERKERVKGLRMRMLYSFLFFLFFLFFCIIALSGPRWGEEPIVDFHKGVDLVLALDVSRSMNVPDSEAGSRLKQGLAIARELVLKADGMRFGAAVGKGRGILAIPLTYDTEGLISFLDSVSSYSVTGSGTNLESLLDAASFAFKDNMPGRRNIVLFSDGEALSGVLDGALKRLRSGGISVCAVGLGSDTGAPVPVEIGPASPQGVLLSADGKAVTSARRASLLKNAAEKTGGIYVDGSRTDAAAALERFLHSLQMESGIRGRRNEPQARWLVFVLAGLISLGLSRLLGFNFMKKSARQRGRLKKASPVSLAGIVLFFLLSASCTGTRGKLFVMEGNFFSSRGLYTEAISSYLKALNYEDSAPYARYGLGTAYFALEEGQAALERYSEAEKNLGTADREDHAELRFRLQYNSGVIYFEKGEFQAASDAFRKALEISGHRIEAKRNLELSLLNMRRSQAPQPAAAAGTPRTGREGANSGSSILFEYLRGKEREQWKSVEWIEEDTPGPDY